MKLLHNSMLSVVIRLIRAFAKAPMYSGTRLLEPTRMTDTGSRMMAEQR